MRSQDLTPLAAEFCRKALPHADCGTRIAARYQMNHGLAAGRNGSVTNHNRPNG